MSNFEARTLIGDEGTRVIVLGAITEASDFSSVLRQATNPVHIDLGGVRRINSIGTRAWIRFIQSLSADRQVRLERCAVAMTQQMASVAGMLGRATVVSVMLPYLCDSCGHDEDSEMQLEGRRDIQFDETIVCPKCGDVMEFDELPETYLKFLSHVG